MRTIRHAAFLFMIGMVEVVCIMLVPTSVVRATPLGTSISGDVTVDTIWDTSGSPYVLDGGIAVQKDRTLILMPGTHIVSTASSTIDVRGRIEIKGTLQNPVDISSTTILVSPDGVLVGSHAFIHDGSSLRFFRATGDVSSILIQNPFNTAITIEGGWFRGHRLRMEGSTMSDVFITNSKTDDGLENVPDVRINESSFVSKTNGAITNMTGVEFDFKKNWWGETGGPIGTNSRLIVGQLQYDEWLDIDPTIGRITTGPKPSCCSSILFIPGLKGTRLYDGNSERIWEPLGKSDIHKLHLNAEGHSVGMVSAGLPIDDVYGLKGVYGSFMQFLGRLSEEGVIHAWHPFGYDWRLPGGTDALYSDSDRALSDVVRLASESQTGKVIIVAHSMGGFLAKKLMSDIAAAGRSSMLDAFVGVAVPWNGAPETIAGLLHGDRQSIAAGLIASASAMRDLAQNMPSAYGLLPTARYFASAFTPSIAFASTTITGLNDGSYPTAIVSPRDQKAFMTDAAHVRMEPSSTDVSSALRNNSVVFGLAESMGAFLDSLSWPFRLTRWNIAGWSKETTVTVEYDNRPGCSGFIGSLWCRGRSYFHRLIASTLGDGTVPFVSAADDPGRLVTLDLSAVGRNEDRDFTHGDILESSTTQGVIERIIRNKDGASFGGFVGVASSTAGNHSERPYIEVFAHSNVHLSVRDERGFHTGNIHLPSQMTSNDTFTDAYETNIPDSSFRVTGEGSAKYSVARVPSDSGHTYTVTIHGAGYGFFTAGIILATDPNQPQKVAYRMMPISPVMSATTTIDNSLVTSIPPLLVDINSDGGIDYTASPDGNGLPGNATSTADANRIAREQLTDVLIKTDTPALRNDPERLELLNELFPPGTNGPSTPATPPVVSSPAVPVNEQKTPPVSGSASCPSP